MELDSSATPAQLTSKLAEVKMGVTGTGAHLTAQLSMLQWRGTWLGHAIYCPRQSKLDYTDRECA